MSAPNNELYRNRFMAEGYPELERLGVQHFTVTQSKTSRAGEDLQCIARLIDLANGLKTIAVVGCGPNPQSVKELLDSGYDAVGVEPVEGSARRAAEFLGDDNRIVTAGAEKLPFADSSQRVVLLESVLEHVDSPALSLAEAYRVLAPGGVLAVYTTNRLKVSLTGRSQDEFRRLFYNWFPDAVKESYVFHHLHYDPRLANYTPRPAVHWFTYTDLCKLGRQSGFAQFYSLIDLVDLDAPSVRRGWLRRWLIPIARRNAWFRALALTQYGSSIFMLKRPQ